MTSYLPFLLPSNRTIVSYAMAGMNHDTPLPEFRIVANTPWAELWKNLNALMKASCIGLMSNQTALETLKVRSTYLSRTAVRDD